MPIRQPIVCVLGHVDTGKTTLLDRIRGTAVQLREAGGLTQHIGASFFPLETLVEMTRRLMRSVKVSIRIPGLLVIDTPGHEAFANLRRRGGSVADIAILVVDVLKGFENQTYESLEILKSRRTPFIVAANKIDLIPGWRSTPDALFLESYRTQDPYVREDLDGRLYGIMGTLSRLGFRSNRFDKVKDFTRTVAIVPLSAKTGEGVGELLAVLIGLTQQYLQDRLTTTSGPARGTVLEVREEVGLGTTINAVVYDGILRREDVIVVGGREKPIVTTVRAILMPQPLDEIRDPRKRFIDVEEVSAAAGVKIAAPDLEGAVAGAPIVAVGEGMPLERAVEEVSSEVERLRISTDKVGVVLKTDTLGSLEALTEGLRARGIPIRLADIGDVSKRDVMEAIVVGQEEPLYGAILAFNVRVLPDAEEEARAHKVRVFEGDIIYNLMDEYIRWMEEERERRERSVFDRLVKPGKVEVLRGFIFRRAKPAIFGVRVLAGVIEPNRELIREEGRNLGRISQIQDAGRPISLAEEGKEVAISMPRPVVGRHIREGDVLYVDIPEEHAKMLRDRFPHRLSEESLQTLRELIEIKRRSNPIWAL
ncbi:MAG: translation initiation factor aIF-2 [Candidatus Bathyarchaeota archaeon B23]|nr:MAG: translation initiation factor aIF-2 [Candidatus Bathyarchaeota archaeon B23]